jgi:hypothetical protein
MPTIENYREDDDDANGKHLKVCGKTNHVHHV